MKLIRRGNVGEGLHRSGWPVARDALQQFATDQGILLDDCVIQSMRFFDPPLVHREPWIGIFHSPLAISGSPCRADRHDSIDGTLNSRGFRLCSRNLRGGITMASNVGRYLGARLGIPVFVVKHPTETRVPQWNFNDFHRFPCVIQLGFHLRNLRAIYDIPPIDGWSYIRIANKTRHHSVREMEIFDATRGRVVNHRVQTVDRLPDDEYDRTLTHSLVLTRPYGVAACNVVVECIARGTPLIIDRSPSAEEYLGSDYCMYYGEHDFSDRTLQKANEQLLDRRGPWLSPLAFAKAVNNFCRILETAP